ncbi:transposase [Streptosporangium sp. NPDC023963]|uniref:transposase n=1 Tax=Streptosporangium sp. NPDC023963 TaxID=3155608 RepID=UPI00343B0ABB
MVPIEQDRALTAPVVRLDVPFSVAVTRRFDVTDAQWAVLEPLLPKGKKPGRPPKWSRRQLIDGIRWRIRVGSPWRDVPACYGHWRTVYGLFWRWQSQSSKERIHERSNNQGPNESRSYCVRGRCDGRDSRGRGR